MEVIKSSTFLKFFFDHFYDHMVGLNGLEPSTSRLSGVRSNQLSYRPVKNNGAGDENRTHDQSLEGSCFTTKLHPHKYGREDRIWTCDPLVPNQVLYQAEPLPVSKYGAPWEIRTPDLLIRSQTLYPAELRAHI